jgi:hypothetical protein
VRKEKKRKEILWTLSRKRMRRLPKPENCPDELYELLLKCWEQQPENRPMFKEILAQLKAMVQASGLSHSVWGAETYSPKPVLVQGYSESPALDSPIKSDTYQRTSSKQIEKPHYEKTKSKPYSIYDKSKSGGAYQHTSSKQIDESRSEKTKPDSAYSRSKLEDTYSKTPADKSSQK